MVRPSGHDADQVAAGKYDRARCHDVDARVALEIRDLFLQADGKTYVVGIDARDEAAAGQRHRFVETCGQSFSPAVPLQANALVGD